MRFPFDGVYSLTNLWSDPATREAYKKFGLLGHNGQDYALPQGTKVLAPHSGKIIESLFDASGYGWYVKIENSKEGSILAHFKDACSLKVGKEVKEGDLLGLSGNTGNSTGPHLHWGYYRFPRRRDNGFSGTIDQTHWMDIDDGSEKIIELEGKLSDMRGSRDAWRTQSKIYGERLGEVEEKLSEQEKIINNLQAVIATNKTPLDEYSLSEILRELLIRVGLASAKGGEDK